MRRAVITGVTGQDGPYLVEELKQRGVDVIYGVVRRCARDLNPDLGVRVIEGDVRDPAITARVVAVAPTEIYNLAAMSHVGHSFECPADVLQTNTLGCLHMLDAAREANARFYQASTSEIFGNQPGPQSERTPLAPASPYAVSKAAAYHMVRMYREAYGVFACNGILFNHESPRRGADFVTQKVVQAAVRIAAGLQDHVHLGAITASRDWGHAIDYVRGMVDMLEAEKADDYVLATGKTRTVLDLCDVAFAAAGISDASRHVVVDVALRRPADVWALCGDASKAKRELGWQPVISFQAMIEEMVIAYARDQHLDLGRNRGGLRSAAVGPDDDGRAVQAV